jgi:hypothetical protein
MERSLFSEANISPASQEASHILRNTRISKHVHNSLPITPILGQINPDNVLPNNSYKIHLISLSHLSLSSK